MKNKIFSNVFIYGFAITCFFSIIFLFSYFLYSKLESFVTYSFVSKTKINDLQNVVLSDTIELIPNAQNLKVSSESAYLEEFNDINNKVLFFKNENKALPIASLTKLMSAIIVLDNIELTKEVEIMQGIPDWQETKTIKQGEVFLAKDLLKISLIESNNSAIIALSNLIGQEKFVDLMNKKIKEIGLKNTKFFNETGLDLKDKQGNYSTAKDLASLSKYILNNYPEIFNITKELEFSLCDIENANCRTITNTNQLLKNNLFGKRIIGGKTGETRIAKGCLIILLEGKDKTNNLISVALGSQDRFADTEKIIKKFDK